MITIVLKDKAHLLDITYTSKSICGEDIGSEKTRYVYNGCTPPSITTSWDTINESKLCLDCYGEYLLNHSSRIWWYKATAEEGVVYTPVDDCYLQDHEEMTMSEWLATNKKPWKTSSTGDRYTWIFEDIQLIRIDNLIDEYYDENDTCEKILKEDLKLLINSRYFNS